jgi:hypothetical protein
MRNVFITAMALALSSTAAFANPTISGEVELKFAESANENIGGSMGVDLNVDAGMGAVALEFSVADGGDLTLDNWAVGTSVSGIGVHFGDDLGVMPGAEGEHTLAAPVMAESLRVTVGDAQVAFGLTDWSTDVTDISNIQGSYKVGAYTFAGDYNLDSENIVVGAGLGGFNLGVADASGAITYDTDAEVFGFEGVLASNRLTAYANGDDEDPLQNIGGDYAYNMGPADVTFGANYNLDEEEITPTATIGFSF